MKDCHCFSMLYLPPNNTAGEEKKNIWKFLSSMDPIDLNLCLQVNNVSKLSIRNNLEEFGLLKAARTEAVGKILC